MIGAILIMLPRTAALAAVLGMTMVGAIGAHLFIVGRPPISAIGLLVATTAIAWYRGVYE